MKIHLYIKASKGRVCHKYQTWARYWWMVQTGKSYWRGRLSTI